MQLKTLKDLRTYRKLSQSALGTLINNSQRAVSNWENGITEPDLATLIALSKVFEVSVDYLIGNIDDEDMIAGIPSLSPEDKILFDYYHALSADGRAEIIRTMKVFKQQECV